MIPRDEVSGSLYKRKDVYLCHQAVVVRVRDHLVAVGLLTVHLVVEVAVGLLIAHLVVPIAVVIVRHIAILVILLVVQTEEVRVVVARVLIIRLRTVRVHIQEAKAWVLIGHLRMELVRIRGYLLMGFRYVGVKNSRKDIIKTCQVTNHQLHIIVGSMIICIMLWDGQMRAQVLLMNQVIMMRTVSIMMKLY